MTSSSGKRRKQNSSSYIRENVFATKHERDKRGDRFSIGIMVKLPLLVLLIAT